jgi:23S rRNA pseudouridine1911/1915/1917 synthase
MFKRRLALGSQGFSLDSEENHKIRLDQRVTTELGKLSRSSSAKLIELGKVTVNGKPVSKTSFKVDDSDIIKIDYIKQQIPDNLKLPILYEDNDCIVINKPLGVLTHSKGAFNPEATVATWLQEYLQDISGDRAGIVHRLDRLTSGVMICAKNQQSMRWLQKQFSQRKTKKTYVAVIEGQLAMEEAVIDMPIQRNPKKPQTFRVSVNGKPAVTNYKLLKTNTKLSLIELKPTTGRTHQLRVHLNKIGHPIYGDTLYGGQPAERMFLHALELEITLPSRDRKTFRADLPNEFKQVFKA